MKDNYDQFIRQAKRVWASTGPVSAWGRGGNLLDKVISGQVTDYLSLFYVFNAADFAIIAGALALLVAALRGQAGGRGSASA